MTPPAFSERRMALTLMPQHSGEGVEQTELLTQPEPELPIPRGPQVRRGRRRAPCRQPGAQVFPVMRICLPEAVTSGNTRVRVGFFCDFESQQPRTSRRQRLQGAQQIRPPQTGNRGPRLVRHSAGERGRQRSIRARDRRAFRPALAIGGPSVSSFLGSLLIYARYGSSLRFDRQIMHAQRPHPLWQRSPTRRT